MHNCPNCGRPTCRTEDWACQWCGYPLLSKAYQKIPKTFQQLQEERRTPIVSEPIPDIVEVFESTPALEPEPIIEPQPEQEPVQETSQEIAPSPIPEPISEPEPAVTAEIEPEQAPISEEEAVPEMEAAQESETITESELEPQPVLEPEPILEPQPEQEPVQETSQEIAPSPIPEPISEPEPAVIAEIEPSVSVPGALTVEELDASFQANMIAADAGNQNKVLTLSGVVDKVVVNDNHEIYYCILSGAGKKVVWNIRCTFDKRNGAGLKRLTRGQAAVVQGKYDGYSKNIILKDCVVLS